VFELTLAHGTVFTTPALQRVVEGRWLMMRLQLTAATAAVITKLSASIHNELALRQFVAVGVLLQFESLVSCHGDEMGMLEDMDTAMHDLAGVWFTVTSRNDGGSTTATTVSGSRLITFTYLLQQQPV